MSDLRNIGGQTLVGREKEMALLREALDSAAAGAGQLLLLRGEAGIGKSRLARELIARARELDFAVGIGFSTEGDAAPSFGPWREALRGSEAGIALGAAGSSEHSDLKAHGQLEAAERFARFDDVDQALARQEASKPVLLVLEDLHWADLDSLKLLSHLAQRSQDRRRVILATARESTEAEASTARVLQRVGRFGSVLSLSPLEESEVSRLIQDMTGLVAGPDLVAEALRRSGGNPFFLRELLTLTANLQGLSAASLRSAAIPSSLEELLDRHLEGLSSDTLRLLRRCAFLGDDFDVDELARWCGNDAVQCLAELEPARRSRIIESGEPGQLRFCHGLLRDALLEGMPLQERTLWHRDIAAHLEELGRDQTEPELARLAEHHRRSLSAESTWRAIECSEAAATRARGRRAVDHVARHLRLALGSFERLTERTEVVQRRHCEVLLALGHACLQTGESEESVAVYTEAAEIARDLGLTEELAQAAMGIVGREDVRGAPKHASDWVELALRMLGGEPSGMRVLLLATASHLAANRTDLDRAEALARDALELAGQLSQPEPWVDAAQALHGVIDASTRPTERLALSDEMVARSRKGLSSRTLRLARQTRLADRLLVGDIRGADEELAEIEKIARDRKHPDVEWHALCLRAGVDLREGRLARAEKRIHEAYAKGRAAGRRHATPVFSIQMFHLREAQGRLGELRPAMQEVIERDPDVRALSLMLPLATMQEGNRSLTRVAFDSLAVHRFEDVPRTSDWLPVIASCGRVAAYLGDLDRCALLLDLLQPYDGLCIPVSYGWHWEGSVARTLAQLEVVLGFDDAARDHFNEAIACHRGAGAMSLLAETLYQWGLFQKAQGNSSAEGSIREALDLYRNLGVSRFIELCEEALAGANDRTEQGQSAPDGCFERDGEIWTLAFEGREVRVGHRKGMTDLAMLLEVPGREIHVLALTKGASGARSDGASFSPDEFAITHGPSALPALDASAIAGYRSRLEELARQREEAQASHDLARQLACDEELEWIEGELTRARNAPRGEGSEFTQKSRKAVYNRIRAAIASIAKVHPALAEHLQHSVRTGVTCVYRPEHPKDWLIRSESSP